MGVYPEEEEDEDDITEIREGEDGSDYYEGYEYEEQATGYEEEGVDGALPPAGALPAAAGPQLMGLLCPKCRQMCQGVQALKEHMQVCQGTPRGPGTQGNQGQSHHMPEEEPQVCQICDKSFKSTRTLDNHMKKQHGLAGTPKGQGHFVPPKGRGRPKKGGMQGWGHGGEGHGGSTEYQSESLHPQYQSESLPGSSKGRPVGQVAPAQRSTDSPALPAKQGEAGKGAREGSGSGASGSGDGRGRGSPRGGLGRGSGPPGSRQGYQGRGGPGGKGRDGEPKPDLQKLGMKFGGQISITSTGNQAGKKSDRGNDGQGVSVTKLKGDVPIGAPVSIKDAKGKEKGETSKQGEAESTVKEEPKEFEEEEGVGEEVEEETGETVGSDDFGNYDGGDFGPGGDELYAEEGDYAEGEVDQEGMDIEYFSQYKEREEFDGRTGMFQGEYGEGDPDMEGEGEYEEEA